jgi:hypothetical protein
VVSSAPEPKRARLSAQEPRTEITERIALGTVHAAGEHIR